GRAMHDLCMPRWEAFPHHTEEILDRRVEGLSAALAAALGWRPPQRLDAAGSFVTVFRAGFAPIPRSIALMLAWLTPDFCSSCSCVNPASSRAWRRVMAVIGHYSITLAMRCQALNTLLVILFV